MIYHVARNVCIRAFKEIISLRPRVDVRPVGKRFGYQDMMVDLGPSVFWSCANDLAVALKEVDQERDVVHVHAEPGAEAGLAAFCRLRLPHVPIVLDVHDAEWGRYRGAAKLEVDDLVAADSAIVTSRAYQGLLMGLSDGPPLRPEIVPSACLYDGVFSPDDCGDLGGICYEGGIDVDGWRDYRELFSAISSCAPVFCYAPNAHDLMMKYHQTGAVMQMRPYKALLADLTRHNWALVCPPCDGNLEWRGAMPNKFFEALMSGLPVLTYGCEEVCDMVEQHKLGFSYRSRDELLRDSVTWRKPPAMEMRERCVEWAMNHGRMGLFVHKILEVYDRARVRAGNRRKAVPA